MAEVVAFKTPKNVLDRIKKLAADSGRVSIIKHAKKQMAKRGITRVQVLRTIRCGGPTEGPFLNAKGNWQVNITGRDSGSEITVVAVLEEKEESAVVVITAM